MGRKNNFTACAIAALSAIGIAPALATAGSWNAFNDFWVDVPATGGGGNFTQTDWVNSVGLYPGVTGLTAPNAWGYAGGNFNGVGAPNSVGTYVSGGNFYPLTAGNTYAGPGASYLTGGVSFWIGYNDQYGIVGLPNAQTQIGKYTSEWFSGSPNYTANSGGANTQYLWIQATGLSPDTNGLGAMLTWTAPSSGNFKFSGSYVNGNYGQNTDFAIVDSGSATLLSTVRLAPASSISTFEFTKTYSAGDMVQFQVGTPAAAQGSPLGLAVDVVTLAPSVITINVASGTQTQTAAGYPLLSGTTPVEKTGAGTVVFDQANTLAGPTTVSQGTVQLAAANTLSTSAVTVAAGATLSVGPQVAAVVPALVNNGLVDVGLGGLTVASGQTTEGIVAAIIAGRTDGTWSGTSGITSSAAATQSERAVGWLNNGDGSFTVAFGAAGDWNLNGTVDFDDVVQFVSANLYDTGLPATWADGDYDYNGVVDFDDVVASVSANLFDTGPYNTAPGGLSTLGFSGGIVAVPEPATWGLMAVGVACVAGRRRSRSTQAL